MSSKLERDLAQQLALMARDERWPYGAPVEELRFDWCCDHAKKEHGQTVCFRCSTSAGGDHEFRRGRAFRFDLAYPAYHVAVECEGGGWTGGRHTSGAGFEADLVKYALATTLGWTVIRVSQRLITSGLALTTIEAALRNASAQTVTASESAQDAPA